MFWLDSFVLCLVSIISKLCLQSYKIIIIKTYRSHLWMPFSELIKMWRCLHCQKRPRILNLFSKAVSLQPEQAIHSLLQVGPRWCSANRVVSTMLPFTFSWDTLMSSAFQHLPIYLIFSPQAIWGLVCETDTLKWKPKLKMGKQTI